MSEFGARTPDYALPEDESLSRIPGSLSALYYVAAINFGAEAINHLSNGASLHNVKYFVGETIISGLAASRGITHLEEYLQDRKAARADAPPAAAVALSHSESL